MAPATLHLQLAVANSSPPRQIFQLHSIVEKQISKSDKIEASSFWTDLQRVSFLRIKRISQLFNPAPFLSNRLNVPILHVPLYDIEHHTPRTPSQQSSLAIALTNLHTKTFHTPRFFINVRFTPLSESKIATFRGGEPAIYNRAILRTRASGSRSVELYNKHCHNVVKIWEEVMGLETQGQKMGEMGLRTVWVLGALTTAVELGVERPMVGEEGEWLQKNKPRFKELARAGDKDMKALVKEEFGVDV